MKINFIRSTANKFKQTSKQSIKEDSDNLDSNIKGQNPSYFQFYNQYFISFKGLSATTNLIPKEDLCEFTLPNNLKVIVDTDSKNNKTDIRLKLTENKDLKVKSGVSELVSQLLEQNSDKVSSDFEKDNLSLKVYAHSHLGNIDGYVTGASNGTLEGLSTMLKQIYDPLYTEADLKKAKADLKTHYFNVSQDKNYQLEDELRHGSLDERKNSIDSVTISDIQNYYKDFLANSEGTIVVSMQKSTYDSQKNDILNVLSNSIPNLSTNKNSQGKSYTSMLSKNITIKNIQNEKTQLDKYYSVPDEITIKASVVNAVLENAIKLILQKNLSNNSDVTPAVAYYPIKNNGYLNISLINNKNVFNIIEKKTPDMINSENLVQTSAKQLMTVPLSSSELDEIKQDEKKYILKTIKEQSNKTDVLINQSQGNYNYLNDYYNAIDSITADDIQQSAKKIFSKPAITIISNKQP